MAHILNNNNNILFRNSSHKQHCRFFSPVHFALKRERVSIHLFLSLTHSSLSLSLSLPSFPLFTQSLLLPLFLPRFPLYVVTPLCSFHTTNKIRERVLVLEREKRYFREIVTEWCLPTITSRKVCLLLQPLLHHLPSKTSISSTSSTRQRG